MVDRRLRRLDALEGAVFSTFLPFFVLWLRDRGFSPSEIGVILSSSALVGVIAAPVWSSVADRRAGTVRTLQVAFVSAAVLAIALALTGSAFLAVAGRRRRASPCRPGAAQTATDRRPRGAHRSARRACNGYGSFRLWASVGWGVGAIAFGALFQCGRPRTRCCPSTPPASVGVGRGTSGWFPRRAPDRHPARRTSAAFGCPRAKRSSHGARLRAVYLLGVFLLGAVDAPPRGTTSRCGSQAGGGGPLLVGVAAGVSAFVEIPFMRSSEFPAPAASGLRARVRRRRRRCTSAASLAWAVRRPRPRAVTRHPDRDRRWASA